MLQLLWLLLKPLCKAGWRALFLPYGWQNIDKRWLMLSMATHLVSRESFHYLRMLEKTLQAIRVSDAKELFYDTIIVYYTIVRVIIMVHRFTS